ncbi:FliM/FliN family flagellar motor switch protein [Agaribacter flavus]|uniref:FliM/FliN family flagellar motor switch protein n=1 Tax=Agaribacter flavus TaxID=1902781 RepID=A0ABV7FML7_9ALTE
MLTRTSVVGRSSQEIVRTKLIGLVESWKKRWFDIPVKVEIEFSQQLFRRIELREGDSLVRTNKQGKTGSIVIQSADESLKQLILLMSKGAFDDSVEADNQVLDRLTKEILDDLANSISMSMPFSFVDSKVPQESIESSVVVNIRIFDITLSIHFDNNVLELMGLLKIPLKAQAIEKSIVEAIQTEKLELDASLDDMSVDIGTLSTLQKGQVLPLTHRLEQSINISVLGRSIPINGYLVKNNTKKAVLATSKELL